MISLLPNPPLPSNTSKIKTATLFKFPITDDLEAKEFVRQIVPYYRVQLSLPAEIMQANPTDKPTLPSAEEITKYHNIFLSITTTQQLTTTARLLCKYYYFNQLPSN